MFKPFPMLRIRIILLKEAESAVLWSLGQQEVIHFTRTSSEPDTALFQPIDVKQEFDHCKDLLERSGKLDHQLQPFIAEKEYQPITLQNRPALKEIESTLHTLENQAACLFDNRQKLLGRKKELDTVCDQVSGFRDLNIPMDQLNRFSFLHFITGNLPEGRLEMYKDKLGGNTLLLPLPGYEARPALLIMTTLQNRHNIEHQLQQIDFRQEPFPSIAGLTANTFYLERDQVRHQVERQLLQADEEVRSFALATHTLRTTLSEKITIERRLIEAAANFSRTDSAVLLSGWIPADRVSGLNHNLEEITKGRCVIEITQPDEALSAQVPVLLQHRTWLCPFQKMVSAYGLPEYSELEPTLFVAISYVLMFGMMFGDAGQGAIMAICGIAALRAGRSATLRNAGRLLISGGFSSIFFGALYGSYFGIPQLKQYALWRDPLEGDSLTVIVTAIGLGVVVISTGVILNIINQFRRKDFLEGLLGRFGLMGILFYWGALVLLTQHTVLRSHQLLWQAIILFLALPLAGWILKPAFGMLRCRWKGKPTETDSVGIMLAESSVSALEGVILYLANTTSFVRLAAYAMSHAALLMAAFSIAAELKGNIPNGTFWGLLVIILGNLIALILEGVIIAVQALRLEFYEFFGKFFSGQGLPFSPFSFKEVSKGAL